MVSMKILRILLEPIFWLYAEGFKKSDYLPPLTNELLKISAVDLAAKIRRKEVSLKLLYFRFRSKFVNI